MSGIPGAIGSFIANLVTKPGGGFSDGMNAFGEFDVDSFINANLQPKQGGKPQELTQGLARLLGFGPKKLIGVDDVTQNRAQLGGGFDEKRMGPMP